MKPKDIFGLAVRILGLVILYHLLLGVPTIIAFFSGCDLVRAGFGLVGLAAALGVVWWLVGGAPLLMERAYPETKKDDHQAPTFGKQADA